MTFLSVDEGELVYGAAVRLLRDEATAGAFLNLRALTFPCSVTLPSRILASATQRAGTLISATGLRGRGV